MTRSNRANRKRSTFKPGSGANAFFLAVSASKGALRAEQRSQRLPDAIVDAGIRELRQG